MRIFKASLVCLLVIVIILLLIGSLLCVAVLGFSETPESETLLTEVVSPNGTYSVKAFRTNPGATVDFSIRCYVFGKEYTGEKVYDAYHESSVNIEWISDNIVCINNRRIDLSKRQTYDWRDD